MPVCNLPRGETIMTTRFFAALAALCLGLAAALSPTSSRADTITMSADFWCPFNCQPGSDRPGYMVEIAREIFEAAGHRVEYTIVPWSRTLVEVMAGRTTAAIGASPSESRNLLFPSEALGMSANGFAMRKGTGFKFTGPESLSPWRLGGILDYGYDDGGPLDAYIQEKKTTDKVQLISGDEGVSQNLRKLMGDRVDLVIDETQVLAHAVAELDLGDHVTILEPDKATPIYLAFSAAVPKSKEYMALLDDGVRRMRASGRLAEILARYGVKDWAAKR